MAALAALTGAAIGVHRLHRLRRALSAERAARRLTDASHHHDLHALTEAMHRRLADALHAGQALAEADTVLTTALTDHRPDPEGGTPS
ncbi:hypothetical protein ACFC08_28450 [Streptomyces sp. NPDC056112]|uniref:hypothetical protein n=1 Tax=Streptomyces sp. NPDC056112 TaxID=3345715 RepID=UPI0035DBB119